jgi:plastocyanin
MALLGVGLIVPAIAGSKANPKIEAFNEGVYFGAHHFWKPSSATVTSGGAVNLSNPTTVNHGVEWRSGPTTPSCTSGVPVGTSPASSGSKWAGTCTFTQTGTYTFYCTVHGAEMTATVTVNPAPLKIRKLSPKKGPPTGATSVTITGTGFTGATAVKFGSVDAAKYVVSSDTLITAVSPPEPSGVVDVRVTTPAGTSPVSGHDHFKYLKH